MPTRAAAIGLITPGAQVVVRDEDWLVRSVADTRSDGRMVRTVGISELVRDEEATFFTSIDDVVPVRPEDTVVVADETGGYRRSRLWLEAVIRKTPVPVSDDRIVVGHRQLLTEMAYQRWPAHKALTALRPRLLIQLIEDFGLADKPVRVLVTTDISSEGVNLHRQCHHLIHFDVPWSLITVQQRNGRIDRYGQRHRPEIRALLLTTHQTTGAVSDEHRVASRLLEREDEVLRTLGDVAPILGVYSAAEEEKAITAGLQRGAAATEIVPDAPKGFDLLTWLTGGTPTPESAPTGDLPALIADDWTFVLDALHEVIGDPRKELDMQVEPDRRFVALNPPKELQARLRMLPDEVVRDASLMSRLKLTTDREFAEQALKQARERKGSGSLWPDVGFIGAHHPLLEWLVDKLLVKFGRNEAPIIGCGVTRPTFCVLSTYTNKRGQPTIVEWLAIEAPGSAGQRIRPLFEVLASAGVRPAMANPCVGHDAAAVRELQKEYGRPSMPPGLS